MVYVLALIGYKETLKISLLLQFHSFKVIDLMGNIRWFLAAGN